MELLPVNFPTSQTTEESSNTQELARSNQTFSEFISSTISQVEQAQLDGDRAIEKLHSGEAQNLHDVMISVEQADLSLRMLVQVRNKALQAYEEIMRMQI